MRVSNSGTAEDVEYSENKSHGDGYKNWFDGVIEDIVRDHCIEGTEKEKTEEFTRKQLHALYDEPKLNELELVLRKRITKEEARRILFSPNEDQATYYQALIANPPKGAPKEHPQRTLQFPHLTLLHLRHWKRWEFVTAFVLAGGLHTLCSLFTHGNGAVRMNAISTLINITAHRDFDWFRPPAGHRGGNTTEMRLHCALLDLRSDSTFISGLIANSWGNLKGEKAPVENTKMTTFPGACLMCLELLAMWLSWVRALHTKDGVLRLSKVLFRAIDEWAGKYDGGEKFSRWSKDPWVPSLREQQQTTPHGKRGECGPVEDDSTPALFTLDTTANTEPKDRDAFMEKKDVSFVRQGVQEEDATQVEPRRGGEDDAATKVTDMKNNVETANEQIAGVILAPTPFLPSALDDRSSKNAFVVEPSVEGEAVGSKTSEAASTVVKKESTQLEENAIRVDFSTTAVEKYRELGAEMMVRGEIDERARVVELAKKLAADFGRFPSAEEEWGEVLNDVEDIKEESHGESQRGDNTNNKQYPSSSSVAVNLRAEDSPLVSLTEKEAITSQDSTDVGDNSGERSCREYGSTPIGNQAANSSIGGIPTQSNLNVSNDNLPIEPTQKARALKEKGNEAFREGSLEAAREAYSAALAVLNAAETSPSSQSPQCKKPLKKAQTSKEAATLHGVLHRNRAAVGLRQFDFALAEARKREVGLSPGDTNKSYAVGRGGGGYPNTAIEDSRSEWGAHASVTGYKGREQSVPSRKKVIQVKEEMHAASLLEQCEDDCLSAIQMDAGDKKAQFRLARCREMRRKWHHGTFSGVVDKRKAKEEQRRQERKAGLVAKILARADCSHEIVGGSRSGVDDRKPKPMADAEAVSCPTIPNSNDNLDSVTSHIDIIRDISGGARRDAILDKGADIGVLHSSDGGEGDKQKEKCKTYYCTGQSYGHQKLSEGGEFSKNLPSGKTTDDVEATSMSTSIIFAQASQQPPVKNASSVRPYGSGIVTRDKEILKKVRNKKKKRNGKKNSDALSSQYIKTDVSVIAKTSGKALVPAPVAGFSEDPSPFSSPISRVRSLRRRLELLAAKAVESNKREKAELEEEGSSGGQGEDLKRVSEFLLSLLASCRSTSLGVAFGDGITVKSLVGVALGLRYACVTDAAGMDQGAGTGVGGSNTERVHQLFLQLSDVKRVGLASAMCSVEDIKALQDVSDHVRHHLYSHNDNGSDIGSSSGGRVSEGRERTAFESAVSALGLHQ